MNRGILIITIVVLIALVGVVWWYRTSINEAILITDQNESVKKPLELVERLKKIQIKTSFFDDPQFLELEEMPRPSIEGIEKGRPNPFLPISKRR